MREQLEEGEKLLDWVGSSKKDLMALPKLVQRRFGEALSRAQFGGMSPKAKALKGFGGAGVIEVVEDYDTDTYRAVYTVRFSEVVYVLHVFQKKSKTGAKLPMRDKKLIEKRLKDAEKDYQERTP